jgi:MSHA biogenesis protein MshK
MINHQQYISWNIGGALLRPLMGVAIFCAFSAVIFPLHAENLPDPTRPPANIFSASGKGDGREARSSAGLRSIIISETRRAAIIDGKTVELGGRLGKARLVEVNAGSVVLQRGKSRQVLTLFPGVKITHREMPDTGSSKMESPKKETQAEQPSQASKVTSLNNELKPAAHDLSGHPKEEK